MAEIDVPGIGKGYYVGLDYQTQKSERNGHSNENYLSADLKPNGKYDDRVLKIVPAKKKIPKADVRVIAEDLSVSDDSDFDFNDVVFDVKMNYPNSGEHTIILQAAGGTLPLKVGDSEVHDLFGVSTTTMVNTGAGVFKVPVTFKYAQNITNINEIPVKVQKNGQWIELVALRGKVASKICVQPRYEWCDERKSIDTVYPNFSQWVREGHDDLWY